MHELEPRRQPAIAECDLGGLLGTLLPGYWEAFQREVIDDMLATDTLDGVENPEYCERLVVYVRAHEDSGSPKRDDLEDDRRLRMVAVEIELATAVENALEDVHNISGTRV